jgi:RsiW-degrading membrane proteinase PrsW (M82 family)
MPKRPRRPDPQPLETDDRPLVVAGVVAWLVGFVVLVVFFRDDLHRHHTTWWLWTCLIGIALGLYGLRFAHRRQQRRQE